MSSSGPRVGIGLPVHNGEQYLEEALDSILAQTFDDFEVIISDNASTDGTGEICNAYAARDSRIRYFRNEENLGAAWNHNRVFELSRGEYFKWISHDDVYAPEFLAKCVEVLDREPAVVLCHTKTSRIDAHGQFLSNYKVTLKTDSLKPWHRFYDLLCVNHFCFQIFGVIRSDALKMTPLLGNHKAADRVLLARLCLLGRFHEIPEYLFLSRYHSERSAQFSSAPYRYYLWWDPAYRGRLVFPEWQLLREYSRSVSRCSLHGRDRLACRLVVGRWMLGHGPGLIADAVSAGRRLFPFWKLARKSAEPAERF